MNDKSETKIDKFKYQNLIIIAVVKSILFYRAGIKKNQNNKQNYLSFLNAADNVMQLLIERFLARTTGENESGHAEDVQSKIQTDPREFSVTGMIIAQQPGNRLRLSGKKKGV